MDHSTILGPLSERVLVVERRNCQRVQNVNMSADKCFYCVQLCCNRTGQ